MEEENKTFYFELDKTEMPEGIKCTLYSLCKEISGSCDDTVDDLIRKFHNNDGSGIMDHLKNDLKFNAEDYNDFQKLQFLKLIYKYEKDKSEGNNAFQITKVLARPRVENINSPYYGVETLYGDNYEKFLSELESVIGKETSEERKRALVVRNQRWNNVLSTMMRLSFEEEALKKDNFEIARQELLVIRNFLQDKIYKKLEEPKWHKPVDNIFMAFYTYLIEHMMICEEEDRVRSYNTIELYESADDEYVKSFVEWDKYVLLKEGQEKILDKLISDGECLFEISDTERHIFDMKYMIFRKTDKLNKDELSSLRLARRYLENLREWVNIQKPLEIPEDSLLGSWFIAIVQEIAYCKMNHVTVKNDAYGVEEKKKTLTATLKNADSTEAKHIQEWMIRIEDRYSSDIGGTDLQIIVREIESVFQAIRSWALQHHDLEDFIFVDNALVHTVERLVVPRFIAANNLDKLEKYFVNTGLFLTASCYCAVGKFNLGREMELDKTLLNRIAKPIMRNKKKFDKSTLVYKEYKDNVMVHYETYNEYINYFYMYSIERNGQLRILYFRPQGKQEIIDQYKSYGIGQLAVTGKE